MYVYKTILWTESWKTKPPPISYQSYLVALKEVTNHFHMWTQGRDWIQRSLYPDPQTYKLF